MTFGHIQFSTRTPAATSAVAQHLARRLKAGDCLLLEGSIGAGKTHFARSLIQALLPFPEDIPSPTFTLVQTYEADQFDVWHSDLYRLSSLDEVHELGLIDAFETDLCIVEWPDRLGRLAPDDALHVSFRMTDVLEERRIEFRWNAGDWAKKLEGLPHD